MNDAKEEIRARLAVEDVVGQYIELTRAGRNLKGRSPWGEDRTPSFMVSPEKGIWHDFSANKGGDIFTFVMEVEGIPFREALEKLARQAGVELARYDGGDKKVARKKERAREAVELACKFYQFCLSKNKSVCEYVFYKRNMNRGTVKEFRIGYAPKNGKALVEFLQKRGFKKEEMETAGLLNRFGGDLFRGRMMVPFIDANGVIGFTARVLDKSEPKYLNTPETLLFNKSRFIFGLAQAKEAIRKSDFVVIVEGNMDVISSHQAGVKEAVATSGTAMTEQHLKILSRLTKDVRLAYDGDAAGVKATERAIGLASKLGISLSVICDYEGAKDPDELIQKGAELWQKAVEKRRPAMEWLLEKYEERFDLTTGDGKREYAELATRTVTELIASEVEKSHYLQTIAKRLSVTVEDLKAERFNGGEKRRLKTVKTKVGNEENTWQMIENTLLAIAMYGGIEVGIGFEIVEDEAKLAELEMIFNERYDGWETEDLRQEVEALQKRWQQGKLRAEIEELNEKLNEEMEEIEEKKIMEEIMIKQRELSRLLG